MGKAALNQDRMTISLFILNEEAFASGVSTDIASASKVFEASNDIKLR